MQIAGISGLLAFLALVLGGLGIWRVSRQCREPGRTAEAWALAALGFLIASWLGFEFSGVRAIDWSPLPADLMPHAPGLLLTRLALSLSGLVALLNFLVVRYARRYMAADSAEARFFVWSQITIGCVQLMILSNNFVLLLLAWLGTSLGLHKLLTLYKDRPSARRTAALKFMISRIGDAALLMAAVLMWQEYKSFHFPTVMDAAATAQPSHLIAILLVYGVMAAQFESWLHPVTILLSLPLTVPFALLSLLIFNQGVNIFSMLGILVLFGVVKKNAILQIDHTIQLRAKGLERNEAVLQANRDRLRPILMTSFAMIAGMVPMAFKWSEGAESAAPLGRAVIGGLAAATVATLLVLPAVFAVVRRSGAPKLVTLHPDDSEELANES